ncbi:MAG TPA: monovalent cation:proton antiporter-2 (CPA2) family protein [Casimicrobiaceae bacterium]
MLQALPLIVVLLAVTVVVVVICRLVRLPPILGYLIVGIAFGPHSFGWVADVETTRSVAEFGIVFLLFSVGLEFSLPKLRAMRRAVFGLGLAQVAATTAAGTAAGLVAGFGWQVGLVLGGAFAMSSTAIVIKMLSERNELATQHGRDAVGILLFQDLAVVAFLIVIPSLHAEGTTLALALGLAAVKAALALGVVLYAGQRPMRWWFSVIARQRSRELFTLNLLFVALGLAALTEVAGLSLELGAFLAGMLIAETEFRYQVEEDIAPFRDVLLGLFFVTVGMSLDLRVVVANFPWVLALLVVPVAAKLGLIVLIARGFGSPLATALRTGLYLAQAGELAIVMLALAVLNGIVDGAVQQTVLAAMVLSMLFAPLLIQNVEPIVRRLTANDWLARAAHVTAIATQAMSRQDHVIVCGYGRSGQNLARLLEAEEIPLVALDNDPYRVREASGAGATVVYGDAGRRETLVAAGLAKARAVVVTFADVPLALKILHEVHAARPDLPVVVRTVDDTNLDALLAAGATEVVPEVLEGSLMLASHSLLLLGVPLNRVLARIRAIREERYSLFRGFFHGATDAADAAENLQPRLKSVLLTERAAAVGQTLEEIGLEGLVEIRGVRRRGSRSTRPTPDWRFESGDVVVLLGRPENLAIAEGRLLEG